MQKKIDLVNGPVLSSLTRLAVPIMATSLIQMAYNMTDMIWIGPSPEAIEALVEAGRLAPGDPDVRTELAAVGAPELAVENDRPRSAHVRDLARVGGRLEQTLDALHDWL